MAYSYAGLGQEIAKYSADEVLCGRLVARAVQVLNTLTDPAQIAEFHAQPVATGDSKWDNLIAGVAEYTWSLSGQPGNLAWADEIAALPDWWEPGNMPKRWRTWNMVHTPPSLRERRVIYPRQWLQAV